MKRPLLIVAISYLIGIIIGVYFKISIPLFIITVISNIIFIKKIKRNIKIAKSIILALLIIIISSAQTVYLNNKYNTLYKSFEGENITFIGTICSSIQETDYKYSITIKIDSVNKSSKFKNTKLILNVKKSKIDNELDKLKYGNKIIITGTYQEPAGRRNYKGFSYKEYLKSKQIYGIADVDSFENIKIISKNNLNFIQLQINQLSNKLKENIKQILPEEVSGLAQGILLGDSSDIDEEIKENFKNCNLSHMLAVSGAHLSYLILGLNLILNHKIIGKKNIKIITIIVIIIFMMITNMSPSVVRAGISAIVGLIGTILYRKQDTYTTISFALLFSLIQNPFSIFNIGMQLSYAGTIGIIVAYAEIEKMITRHEEKKKTSNLLSKTKNYVISSITTTISANILIFPLTVYNFNTISLNFILSNLVTSPFFGVCIILGLFTLVISTISISLAKILSIPLNLLLKILIKITDLIAKIPFANITVITPHIFTIIAIYLIIAMYLIIIKNNLQKKLINKLKKAIAIILVLIIILNLISLFKISNSLQIYFIDVGQGDSCLICTPTGKNILIDGGGNRNPENYDVGEQVLLPYLLDRRIRKIDYIIVSHFDADHAQGLEAVIEDIKVKNIIVSKQASASAQYNKIIELCKRNKVNIVVVKRGGKIVIDEYTYFEILHPSDIMLDDGKGRSKCQCYCSEVKL